MIQIRREGPVAVIALDRAPVNALDPIMVSELLDKFRESIADSSVLGIVLTSTHPSVFSSGFDLKALDPLPRSGFESFVQSFSSLARTMFSAPKPVVAALTGHAIAGGCIIACFCDRVLLAEGKGTVGLSEARLGVPIPGGCLEAVRYRLGERALAEVVLGAQNHGAERALALGLVDQIVPAPELLSSAVELARTLGSHPGEAFANLKMNLRQPAIRLIDEAAASGVNDFVNAWFSAAAREARTQLLDSLKKRAEPRNEN